MDAAEARTICRQEAARRRNALADSGIDDRDTRAMIYLYDNVRVITGGEGIVVASLDHISHDKYTRRHADGVLTCIFDAVPGTVAPRALNPLFYYLAVTR